MRKLGLRECSDSPKVTQASGVARTQAHALTLGPHAMSPRLPDQVHPALRDHGGATRPHARRAHRLRQEYCKQSQAWQPVSRQWACRGCGFNRGWPPFVPLGIEYPSPPWSPAHSSPALWEPHSQAVRLPVLQSPGSCHDVTERAAIHQWWHVRGCQLLRAQPQVHHDGPAVRGV